MSKLKIVTYPHPVLSRKSEPVTDFGPALQALIKDMIETMHVEDGVGLAAPQVGVSKQLLIACPTNKPGEEHVIINPEIYQTNGQEKGSEGCLSVPGISAEILRAKTIRVRCQDAEGKKHDIEAKNFFARVLQHEIDHLNGILLIDRMNFEERMSVLSEYDANPPKS